MFSIDLEGTEIDADVFRGIVAANFINSDQFRIMALIVESMLEIEASVSIKFNELEDSEKFIEFAFFGDINLVESDISKLTAANLRTVFGNINGLVDISAGLDGLEAAFDSIVAFTTVEIGDFCAGEYDVNENFASDLLCICKGWFGTFLSSGHLSLGSKLILRCLRIVIYMYLGLRDYTEFKPIKRRVHPSSNANWY